MRDFYHLHTYTVVPGVEHELWHPNYLQAIKTALDCLHGQSIEVRLQNPNPKACAVRPFPANAARFNELADTARKQLKLI